MADRIVVMHDGVIEQIGAPLELYDHPRNLFVAQFIVRHTHISTEMQASSAPLYARNRDCYFVEEKSWFA